jgi:hypothetical protein
MNVVVMMSVIVIIIIIIIIDSSSSFIIHHHHHVGHRNGERGNCLSGGKDNTGGKDQHIMTAAIYELGTIVVRSG